MNSRRAIIGSVVAACIALGAIALAFPRSSDDKKGSAVLDIELLSGDSPDAAIAMGDLALSRHCATDLAIDHEEVGKSAGVEISPGEDVAAIAASSPEGTTFLFQAGTHVISRAIEAQNGDRFIGAGGAVLDGGLMGDFGAIKGGGSGVEVANLTIQNFGSPDGLGSVNSAAVNRSVSDGWNVHHNSMINNDGAALFLGANSFTDSNCFQGNGQYGVSLPSRQRDGIEVAIGDVAVTNNQFVGNNPNDLEGSGACTGCVGGMKFWSPDGLVVSNNIVESNHGVGIWVDHNGVDVSIDSNMVLDNDKAGIVVETSYNTRVWSNVVARNAVVIGSARPDSDPFPDAGIFISNSGGVEGIGEYEPVIDIGGNLIEDNWGGVTIFEDQNRFCSSVSNESVGRCTLTGGEIESCVSLSGDSSQVTKFENECRWRSRSVLVHDNQFVSSATAVNAALSNMMTPFAEVVEANGQRSMVQLADRTDGGDDLSDAETNLFFRNSYEGDWSFGGPEMADRTDLAGWKELGHEK